MDRNEPLPLYLVTHRGDLAVNDNELIASRAIRDREAGPLVESVVEMTQHQADLLRRMVNVMEIALAGPGDFQADSGLVVHVNEDGSWHRPHAE